jgi:hypothetical protein
MIRINIRPVEIIGECPAGLSLEDEFWIEGLRVENPKGSNLCFLALSHIPLMVWQLQSGSRFFAHASCPGCITRLDRENRVVFLLGHSDKWELCKVISEYRRLCRERGESERARQLRSEAMEYQNRGEYDKALEKMRAALRDLESFLSG